MKSRKLEIVIGASRVSSHHTIEQRAIMAKQTIYPRSSHTPHPFWTMCHLKFEHHHHMCASCERTENTGRVGEVSYDAPHPQHPRLRSSCSSGNSTSTCLDIWSTGLRTCVSIFHVLRECVCVCFRACLMIIHFTPSTPRRVGRQRVILCVCYDAQLRSHNNICIWWHIMQ